MARYANPYHPPCFPQPDFHPQKTHSPSQGRLSASRQVGRLRVPMNGTMLDVARIRLTFCSPLGCTAREADSLPYSGMAICFTAGTIPKSGYRFYKLVVKLEFGEANYSPANVGEDIILPPRWSTACSDEWYFVGHGMERSDLGSPFGRAGCPGRGRLRGSRVPMDASQPSNGVPSQSACSADSSPKGRAKGAVSASAINYNLPMCLRKPIA